MSRLLTDEEIEQTMAEEFRRVQGREAPVGYFKPSINDIAIVNASQKATLKAVGEWAERREIEFCKKCEMIYVEPEWIKAFKRGELPPEVKR